MTLNIWDGLPLPDSSLFTGGTEQKTLVCTSDGAKKLQQQSSHFVIQIQSNSNWLVWAWFQKRPALFQNLSTQVWKQIIWCHVEPVHHINQRTVSILADISRQRRKLSPENAVHGRRHVALDQHSVGKIPSTSGVSWIFLRIRLRMLHVQNITFGHNIKTQTICWEQYSARCFKAEQFDRKRKKQQKSSLESDSQTKRIRFWGPKYLPAKRRNKCCVNFGVCHCCCGVQWSI